MKSTWITLGVSLLAAQTVAQGLPKRPKEMDRFNGQIGTWTGVMKWVAPDMQGEQKISMTSSWDGMFLKTTMTMTSEGMKFVENSMTCWDANKKEYQMYTFTNFATTPRIETMKYPTATQEVWVNDGWDAGMGGLSQSRATITIKDKTHVNFVLEFKVNGKYEKMAEANLTKIK